MNSKCPSCQKPIQVPPEAVGKMVRCMGCQAIFVIEPEPSAAAPPPASAPPQLPPPPPPLPGPEPSNPKKKKTTDAEMKANRPVKKDEARSQSAEAVKQGEPRYKPDSPAKKAPARSVAQDLGDPFQFGGAGPASDFSFDGQHPVDKVNIGVRLRASAAAGFMNYGVAYAVVPAILQTILAIAFTFMSFNPILLGISCFMDTIFIIAAVIIVVGARQLEKMRSFGMSMTGAIFSLLLGLAALLPMIYLSLLFAMALLAGRLEAPFFFALLIAVVFFIQFVFSTWGGIRAMLVLMNGEVRKAMGTPADSPT